MSKQRQEDDERLLQECLRMKPSRAVDRLLTEHPIQRALQLYGNLQERIKRNTSELRSTLTDKYQNLVDCSNLLTSIKLFTEEIEAIQRTLSIALRSDPESRNADASSQRSPISRVEEQLFKKRYGEAMKLSYSVAVEADETERLYLPMLRLQILEALEEEIIERKFTHAFVAEIMECLGLFFERLREEQARALVKNERNGDELLGLIAEALELRESKEMREGDLIEVIFRCKLLSLNRRPHSTQEQQRISRFFHDVLQLISEGEQAHLADIFCRSLQQIQERLLEIFIVKEQGAIRFRFELYERLATSEEFIGTLDRLYCQVAKNCNLAPKVTLCESFLNLWENYYHQLLHLLFRRTTPLAFLPPPVTQRTQYPKEIARYICSDELSLQDRLTGYQNELASFFGKLKQLLKESSQLRSSRLDAAQISEAIVNLYAKKVSELNQQISKYCEEGQEATLNRLGSLVWLFMFCEQFNKQAQIHSNEHQSLGRFTLHWDYSSVKRFHQCFNDPSRKLAAWSIRFDHFFMKYYSPLLASKRQIVKKVILTLLEAAMQASDGERTQAFLNQKRRKAEQQALAQQQERTRLADLKPSDVAPSTFAKKKSPQASAM